MTVCYSPVQRPACSVECSVQYPVQPPASIPASSVQSSLQRPSPACEEEKKTLLQWRGGWGCQSRGCANEKKRPLPNVVVE